MSNKTILCPQLIEKINMQKIKKHQYFKAIETIEKSTISSSLTKVFFISTFKFKQRIYKIKKYNFYMYIKLI